MIGARTDGERAAAAIAILSGARDAVMHPDDGTTPTIVHSPGLDLIIVAGDDRRPLDLMLPRALCLETGALVLATYVGDDRISSFEMDLVQPALGLPTMYRRYRAWLGTASALRLMSIEETGPDFLLTREGFRRVGCRPSLRASERVQGLGYAHRTLCRLAWGGARMPSPATVPPEPPR